MGNIVSNTIKGARKIVQDITGVTAAKEMSAAQRKAYLENQLTAQWGWGYPTSMTDISKQMATGQYGWEKPTVLTPEDIIHQLGLTGKNADITLQRLKDLYAKGDLGGEKNIDLAGLSRALNLNQNQYDTMAKWYNQGQLGGGIETTAPTDVTQYSGPATAQSMGTQYAGMSGLYNNLPSTLGQLQDVVRKYVASLNTGGVTQNYTDMAKNAWNKSYSALGEIPGMTSGQRLSTLAGLEGEYGNALTQAQLMGEQERINRLGMAYGAESGLANQQSQEQMIMQELSRIYGQMGLQLPQYQQSAIQSGIQSATGLPSRSPGSAPLEGPSSEAQMGVWAGQQGMDLIKAYIGRPIQPQSGSNPYGTTGTTQELQGLGYTLPTSWPK